jgi:DNA-binding transcriptional regulator YhcF (GntR family)
MQAVRQKTKRRLFEAARDRIIMDILSSNYQPGDTYSTERELCKRLKVGRNTIRKAIDELEESGMLSRRQRVGIIISDKARLPAPVAPRPESTGIPRVTFVLPHWDNSAGSFLSTTVLGELRNGDNSQQRFSVEMRLFDDPLDDLAPETSTLIVVDPLPDIVPILVKWRSKGVNIIALEPARSLFCATNIQYDVRRPAYDAVQQLYRQGHRSIGLINNGIIHYTFQQWLTGFIEAHRDLGMPIMTNAITMNTNTRNPIELNPKGITAWICPHEEGLILAAKACAEYGLRIPQDVAFIGSDDPGDRVQPDMGCSLTVVRPDYHALSRLIREVLCNEVVVDPGETLYASMTWVYRDSFNPEQSHNN